MEYFAAKYLLSIPDTAHELAGRLSSPKWHEAAEFVLELVNQPTHTCADAFLAEVTEEVEHLAQADRLSALEFLQSRARRLADAEPAARTADLFPTLSNLGAQPGAVRAVGQEPGTHGMDAKTAARVEKLGEVAYRHKTFIEEHGSMTRADSLAIRRQLFGERVQATANLFGKAGSGALFWRDRPFGTPVKNDDPIRLTAEGARIADLWQATHDV
jgi:hypothetical protein